MTAYLLLIALLAAVDIEAMEVACTRQLDLAFVIDCSSSICGGPEPCDEWYAILESCKNIVKSLIIGPDDTRVALLTFGNKIEVQWNLKRYTDTTSLLSAIDNVMFCGGEFRDLVSPSRIITHIFNPLAGDRVGIQNIAILIADGAPNYPDEIYGVDSTAVQVDFTGVFVVCLKPGCSDNYARNMASLPKKVNETIFNVYDTTMIDNVRDPLVKKFCAFGNPLLPLVGK